MSDRNATGVTTARKGSVATLLSYRVTSAGTAGGVSATPIIISASSLRPVLIEGQILIDVPDGDSGTVGIGTTTAGTELVALTTSAGTGFLPANNAIGKSVATDVTTIYIREGGTPSGDARFNVLITAQSLSLQPTN